MTSKPKRRPRPQRALDTTERERVLSALHCERFVDKAPAQVWATLLDEGIYHCSIRTMYRILSEHGEVRERRNQLRHPNYQKPELVAEAPNQVWSWDITKLRGPVKWTYFYLYVILDIFSRYVTGWMLARRESAELARRLISESCLKQNIEADQLTIHADRGSSMRSKSVALLLADLGITKTHSRPYVSNDNPYSESQFKTMKYWSSCAWSRMYLRTISSSKPTVDTKYPRAQKLSPVKLRLRPRKFRATEIALLPLMNPTTFDTANFGGMLMHMWTWSDIK